MAEASNVLGKKNSCSALIRSCFFLPYVSGAAPCYCIANVLQADLHCVQPKLYSFMCIIGKVLTDEVCDAEADDFMTSARPHLLSPKMRLGEATQLFEPLF